MHTVSRQFWVQDQLHIQELDRQQTAQKLQKRRSLDSPSMTEELSGGHSKSRLLRPARSTNPIRRFCLWILHAQVEIGGGKVKVFDNIILLCILISTVGFSIAVL
eukprot:g31863.t1